MHAGRMKYKLTLLQPNRTTNDFGSETVTYTETNTIWAERVKESGHRSEEVGEHFADYDAQFNIRDAHTVAEGWRVQQLGGNLYSVNAIVPNIDRGYKTLMCARVNE